MQGQQLVVAWLLVACRCSTVLLQEQPFALQQVYRTSYSYYSNSEAAMHSFLFLAVIEALLQFGALKTIFSLT